MRKNVILLLIVIVTGAFIMSIQNKHPSPVSAAGLPKEQAGIVRVYGEGEISAEPDVAFINFGVETAGPEPLAAQNENARVMSAVMKALEASLVGADNIRTSNFSISPRYEYAGGVSKKTGYQVHNTVRVKLTDLDSAGKLIGTVTAAGANLFYGIEFGLSDRSAHYRDAVKKALDDARQKARLIAESEGVTLGSLVSVIEQGSHDAPVYLQARAMSDAGAAATPVSPGKLTVKAAVEVTYSI